jgi:hypothetical protein
MKFFENDANEMASLLDTGSLGYKITKLAGKVSWVDMRSAIRQFFLSEEEVESKDTLLFYFSVHGLMDKFGNYYLAPSDIDPNDHSDKGLFI